MLLEPRHGGIHFSGEINNSPADFCNNGHHPNEKLKYAALEAANKSHAPYSGSPFGVALIDSDGKIYKGSYMESAAYNPSMSLVQATLVSSSAATTRKSLLWCWWRKKDQWRNRNKHRSYCFFQYHHNKGAFNLSPLHFLPSLAGRNRNSDLRILADQRLNRASEELVRHRLRSVVGDKYVQYFCPQHGSVNNDTPTCPTCNLYLGQRSHMRSLDVSESVRRQQAYHAPNLPAPRSAIERIPDLEITQDMLERQDTCIICEEEFELGDTVKVLECGHSFHTDCLLPWLEKYRNQCPICRSTLYIPHKIPPFDTDHQDRGSSSGRALEELRASLFNEFRSSEGAKRQQQRICGPAIALSFNFLVAVGIIFMNKMVLQTVNFKFPIFLTLIHYLVSWFFMAALKTFSLLPASPSPKSTQMSSLLFTLGFVMSLSNGLANVSLKYNSIGFYQMAKIFLALAVVSIGVDVATVTDLQFHVFGACVALAWIIPSAVNKILWCRLQQQENWTALALMWKTTPITLIFLVIP
ncbi:hypothetical protein K1719_016467 [Acacia pycnantha]|nr:hypothetical protein K1719_016467 [Acacia pycnantha]